MNVVQTDEVLTVFFDVLALQFVESIDDVVFNLAMRGFFGSFLMKATTKRHSITAMGERGVASSAWEHRFARGVYYLNAVVLLSGMIVIISKQHHGDYRCKELSFTFEEKIWEGANIKLSNGDDDMTNESQLLIYSYFSGMYVEEGLFDG